MTEPYISTESRFSKFSLLILFTAISMICALYIIYNVVKFPSIRQRFHNQTLIILIVLVFSYTLFNFPTTISFFARGRALVENDSFCVAWRIIDYTFTACIIWSKALFTIERYILVFYPHYLRSQRQKLILHYIPLVTMNFYSILFYVFINVICPIDLGDSKPDFTKHLCGYQCLDYPDAVSTYNWLFNILLPVFTVIFGSMILLVRVLWTRRAMQRNLRNWSKNLKMIVQLLSIAIIYTLVWLPVSIFSIITMFERHHPSTETLADHFYFITYLCELTVPITTLFFWPEMMLRLRGRFQTTSVASVTMRPQSTH